MSEYIKVKACQILRQNITIQPSPINVLKMCTHPVLMKLVNMVMTASLRLTSVLL